MLRRTGQCALSALALVALSNAAAFAQTGAIPDYRIAVGDVLSLWVEGAPDLSMSLPVTVNGTIIVPLVGETPAAGRTLGELRANVAAQLAQHVLTRAPTDKISNPRTISREQISLQIQEYRPVYVTGDVAKPGAERFQPGLTLRQALAMAGGYDPLRATGTSPIFDAFDLRSQRETLWLSYAQTLAQIRRIEAEIADAETVATDPDLAAVPISPTSRAQIADAEQRRFEFETADRRAREAALDRQVDHARASVAELEAAVSRDATEQEQSDKDVDSVAKYFESSTVSLTRLLDAREEAATVAARATQTGEDLARARKEADDAEEARRAYEAGRKLELNQGLEEARIRLTTLRSQIDAATDKLLYASTIKSQFRSDVEASRGATVYRAAGGAPLSYSANEDAPLEPGDVVEATFSLGEPLGGEAREEDATPVIGKPVTADRRPRSPASPEQSTTNNGS